MEKLRPNIVLIYAHRDRDFLKRSDFLAYLKDLTREENFWWDKDMSHPLFDEEIKKRLYEADVVVCLVSQSFLVSDYVKKVEAKIAYERLKKEGMLLVPVLLYNCLWKNYPWLRELHHFPADESYLSDHRNQRPIFLEMAEYIQRSHGRALPFRDHHVLYTLRRKLESSLSQEQITNLVKDSCVYARKFVPDLKLQQRICRAATVLRKRNGGRPLSKQQLEELDKRFLAHDLRKPDAEIVRWVLRCHRLHPQGRVAS